VSNGLRAELEGRSRALGFDAFGIATAEATAQWHQRLDEFLSLGRHGTMDWMAQTADRRADPRKLMNSVRSVVMVGLSYAPKGDALAGLSCASNGVISVYAQGRDYHEILKGRLKELAGLLARRAAADVKVFVDTAPLMEKPLAAAAGIGWQGKHTNLVSRQHGSWLFLGAILTDAELSVDAPERDRCGSCRRCLDVCPTDAFPKPYQLDARRCIAYLTVEHKGHIPREFRKAMGNRVFGCDDCLAVCPWNKFARATREAKLAARVETELPPLRELLALSDEAFRARFAGTPVKRSGRARFLRNCLIAAGNSADRSLLSEVVPLLKDNSALVRAMAVWALGELVDQREFERVRDTHQSNEKDPDVVAEWRCDEINEGDMV
jgi:epoxyqueuosine reductase